MWTKRERVMATLSGERPDRAPIFECMAHDGILEHFGGGPIAAGDSKTVLRACSRCLDLCHPVLVPHEPREIKQDGIVTQVVERWSTWTLPQRCPDEREMVKNLHTAIEEAEAWRPSPSELADFRRKAEANNRDAGDMVYIHIGTSCPILPFNIEQGIYACTDYPELTRRWNRAVNQNKLRKLEAIARPDLAPIVICWNDIAFKGRLIYPPYILEEFFYPHLKTMAEFLHSRGIKMLFHSDGDVTEALPRLLDCGMDAFNPLEISAGMTAQSFQEICGSRAALVGGIDAVDVLARGTPAIVAQKTKELIDRFRATGNLIVASASGEVDNSMPTENVLAMYETVWSYGKY